MAVSSSPQPSFLSSLRLNNTTTANLSCSSSPNLSFIVDVPTKTTNPRRRPQSIVVYSSKSNNGLSSDQNREFLERYGLNPDDFLSKPSPKTRRKELRKTGRGKQVPPEEPKPPRETHKLLQVLGGTAKRKKLLSPKGMDVRPMMEVVKGAAFDILQVAGGCPVSLRPGRWLDLYSGTGSVGIEALSRGCSEVHFVEMDPWVVSDVLRPNLDWTSFLDVSVIHTAHVERFLEQAERAKDNDHNLPTMTFITRDYRFFTPSPVHHFSIDLFLSFYDLKTEVYILIETLQLMNCFCVGKDGPFDYISVTPPYTEVDYGVLMDQVSKSSVVGEDTFIVVEYPLRTDMLDSCGCLIKWMFGMSLMLYMRCNVHCCDGATLASPALHGNMF
ncbi:hypothetical protein TEA_004015 [Camellia sinensis var. sinensis]|uniref:Uncharacterized protein n=1 Tax=Camellia sinensis var. sinensis TaxID=542762 RepID=A0A4S4DF29_CAMSN|nr:hypothetical protein TEA_004015 [Camellia sinensis var. sinensis]